jgi:hypothetical protein
MQINTRQKFISLRSTDISKTVNIFSRRLI